MNIVSYKNTERLTLSSTLHAVRTIGRAALLVLAATLILMACPDNTDDGTPSADIVVQNVRISGITSYSAALAWDPPVQQNGYQGVTISAEPPLSAPVLVDVPTATAHITGLNPTADYIFTLTSRYSNASTNTSVDTEPFTTLSNQLTNITVSDIGDTFVAISWQNPTDTIEYRGAMISASPTPPALLIIPVMPAARRPAEPVV